MISCTCWDYQESNLCKHCHKIKAVNSSSGSGDTHPDQSGTSDSSPLQFAFNPQPYIRDEVGKHIIEVYISYIHMYTHVH